MLGVAAIFVYSPLSLDITQTSSQRLENFIRNVSLDERKELNKRLLKAFQLLEQS